MRAAALQTQEKPEVVDAVVPELGEQGVDGIGNYGGTLTTESNPALFHIEAYGRAGSRIWGEWENRRRTDEAMAKAIDFVLAPVRDSSVNVKAAGESSLQQAQADFVKWNLTEALEPGWAEFLDQSAGGAIGCGFALHEKVPEVCEHELLPNGRGYKLAKLAERLPSSLPSNAWIEDPATGELTGIRQQGPKGGSWKSLTLPASKVLLHTWKRNGSNYAGYSAFRAVYYPMRIREALLKMTAVTLVREGAGIPIAFTKDPKAKLTKGQRDSFVKLLQNLVYHENASVVLPAGWEMSWVYSPGANKGHVVDTFNALGLLILEQVGAQQLYLGTSGTGSRSVGEVHQAQSGMFVGSLIRSVEDLFNGVGKRRYTGIVRDLIDWNWGPPKDGKYPKLALEPQKAGLKPQELADTLQKGKAAGLFTVTTKDENWFREKVGAAPIDEAVREAEKEKARAMLPPSPFGQPGSGGQPPVQPPEPGSKASLKGSVVEAFVPRRPLRASEKHVDWSGIVRTFDTSRDKFANMVRPLVAEMLMKALPDVKAAMADGDPSEVSTLKLDTKRLEAAVGKYLEQLRADGYRQVQGERQRAGAGPLRAAAGEEDDKYTTEPDTSAHDDAQAVLLPMRKHLVRKMSQRLVSDLEKEAIDVIRTGGEPEEVVTRTLEYQATTGAFKNDASLVTTKAFNLGRGEFAQEYGSEIESCELSALADACPECDRLDGTTFEFGSAEDEELTPPLSSICDGGDRCRCVKVFNFKRPGAGDGE